MEKLFMFDLQLFAEEVKEEAQPEIPAELEGVSESVAREVMAELPKEESSDDHAEEAEGSTTQEEATQEDTQAQQEASQEVQESQEAQDGHADTDGDKKAGKVPYERFKDVNDKYRNAEQEAQTLRKQLEELQRQQQQASGQVQQGQAQQQAQAQQQQEQQQQEIPMDLLNQAYDVAKKQVLAQLNLSEEDYSDLEYQDDGEKAKVDRAIRFSFDSICQQARERAKDLAAQKQQEQLIMQKAYSDYESMAAEEQKRSDFNDIWQYATTTHFTSMPVYAQAVIQNAFNCVNNGVGTLEQVQLVKDYYNTAKQAYLSGSGSGQAPQQQQATNNKVKQMTTAPRVDKVRGTPSTGGMTIQEIERMVNGDWGKVPDDLKKQILAGRLS